MKTLVGKILGALLVVMLPLASSAAEWASDFPAGTTIPVLDAPDQHGNSKTLAELAGDKGLVLFFNRSFDWCPFCKAQLLGLVEAEHAFAALGYKVATLTYDPVEKLNEVALDNDIAFPLLHDADLKHVNAFGILNEEYEPGHFAYGVPRPGIMVISKEGLVLHKFAEEDYRIRPDFADVLAVLRAATTE